MKRKWILIPGCLLMLTGVALVIFSHIRVQQNAASARETAAQLLGRMPQTTVGIAGIRQNSTMPVLQLEGVDYVAVLEVPQYDVKLPVAGKWQNDALERQSCRYYGSAYNGTLVIGGSDRKGQLDFAGRIDVGAKITVTDMTGAVFSYRVRLVERSDRADAGVLLSEDDLTLFVRNSYGLEYILIRCTTDG